MHEHHGVYIQSARLGHERSALSTNDGGGGALA